MPPGGAIAAAGSYVVTIDGTSAIAKSIEGGTPVGEVVTVPSGPNKPASKTIGRLRYEDIRLEMGLAMGQPMLDWANSLLENRHERKQGAVTYGDANHKARAYMDFRDALLTEFTIPASDASSKDSAAFTIRMAVQDTIRRAGDGVETPAVNVKQKAFLSSNFRLTLGDLPTTRVSRIDALSFTCQVQMDDVGVQRIPTPQASLTETPDLVITFSAADEKAWDQWFTDFCVKGNSGDDKRLSGTLEWLDPGGRRLAALSLERVGIFGLADESAAANSESIRKKTARLFFETAKLSIP